MTTTPLTDTRPWLKWSLIFFFMLWVFAITGVFYVVQKPLSAEDLNNFLSIDRAPFVFSPAALGRSLLDLLTALWLWVLASGLGVWLYDRLLIGDDAQDSTILEKLLFSAGLGSGFVGLLILALGLAGWLAQSLLYSVMILLSLAAAPQIFKLIRQVRFEKPPRLIGLYLLLTLGMGLTVAMLPPTDWDGLFYHLTGPKLYLSAGRIVPGIDIPHLNFPSLFEMLFMLGLALRSAATAKLLHFGFSLLLAGLVYAFSKRYLQLKTGWLAVIFLFSMPMVLTLAGWAYNDLALAFYQVAALYALLRFHDKTAPEGHAGWLILSGLCCGLAMSLKYTSFVAPLTLVALLIWWQWRGGRSIGVIVKSLLIFGLAAGLVATPWYLKNWLFTGNPVYPFVFGGRFWDEYRSAAYSTAGSGIGFDLGALLLLPIQLTLGYKDANYIDGRSGPLFLAFLPLVLWYGLAAYRRKPPALNAMLVFILAQYLFWMLGVIWSSGLWQSRLLLPAFVVLCPILAWLWDDLRHLNHPQFSLQRFLGLFIGVVLIIGLVDQVLSSQIKIHPGWFYYRPWAYLIGRETEGEFLSRRMGVHYAAMAQINDQLPQNAVVVFLWEPRSYYCRRDCRPDSILDRYGDLQYRYGADASAIAAAWRDEGVTHVLIHRLGLNMLLEGEDVPPELRPDPTVLNALEANYFEPVLDISRAYQVYRLKQVR